MLVLIHSGQTGVERGAQRAALAIGVPVAGFCTPDMRDELGRLPPVVQRDLTPCFRRGPRASMDANLQISSALVVVLPDARRPHTATGMPEVLRLARGMGLPYVVVDPRSDRAKLAEWIHGIPQTSGSSRIFVTGPRETRWSEGERISWQLIAMLYDGDRAVARAPGAAPKWDQPTE